MNATSPTAVRRDENLLKKAQAIFGAELVTNAFVTVTPYYRESDAGIKARLNCKAHESAELDSDGGFSYDSEAIILEFSNGRRVEFQNSEWGGMCPAGETFEA